MVRADPGEQDGTDFGVLTCELLGLGNGTLICNGFCAIAHRLRSQGELQQR